MIAKLVKYIEDAREKGFALEEIRRHLSSHGWNEYLIDYALGQMEQRNDRKWLQGSVMAMMVIVLASTGTVWWFNLNSPVASGVPDALWQGTAPLCVVETRAGEVGVISNVKECCDELRESSCAPDKNLPQLRNARGSVVFSPGVSCRSSNGRVLVTPDVAGQCRGF